MTVNLGKKWLIGKISKIGKINYFWWKNAEKLMILGQNLSSFCKFYCLCPFLTNLHQNLTTFLVPTIGKFTAAKIVNQ